MDRIIVLRFEIRLGYGFSRPQTRQTGAALWLPDNPAEESPA
jgi:hypothetical protein